MANKITTFLMFEGKAEQAMHFYVALFDGAEVTAVEKYDAEGSGAEGSIKRATFTLAGLELICIDSPVEHDFSFTPSVSLFTECDSEAEFNTLFEALSKDGKVFMAPDDYGESKKFAWVSDRYGVSWQLNLAN